MALTVSKVQAAGIFISFVTVGLLVETWKNSENAVFALSHRCRVDRETTTLWKR